MKAQLIGCLVDIRYQTEHDEKNGIGAPAAPSVADVDGDGTLEIVLLTFDHGVDVFNVPGSGTQCLPWPTGREISCATAKAGHCAVTRSPAAHQNILEIRRRNCNKHKIAEGIRPALLAQGPAQASSCCSTACCIARFGNVTADPADPVPGKCRRVRVTDHVWEIGDIVDLLGE